MPVIESGYECASGAITNGGTTIAKHCFNLQEIMFVSCTSQVRADEALRVALEKPGRNVLKLKGR